MMEEYAKERNLPPIPSGIILGGVYLYRPQIGRDDDIIPIVLGIVYNIYGLTTLTEYNPNKTGSSMSRYPITDYEKAVGNQD